MTHGEANSMTDIDYVARVAKGVALLDEKRPGWEREIDLDTLNISSGYACVTAQLSGESHWLTGMKQLELTPGTDGTYVAHGFNAPDCVAVDCNGGASCPQDSVYDTLNTLWREAITEKLAVGEESSS